MNATARYLVTMTLTIMLLMVMAFEMGRTYGAQAVCQANHVCK